jgi:hypothetical protein
MKNRLLSAPLSILLLSLALASCVSAKKASAIPEPKPAPGRYTKADILALFREETGLEQVQDASWVEYFQNEISAGTSIVKYTLFISEDDIYSIMAQTPPFSSEWTSSDIYRDYQNEWTNVQKLRLGAYARIYPNEAANAAKPLIEKGFISLSGSLAAKPGTLKMMCVNLDYNTIVLYVIKNG